jgi:hypothetical protein
MYILSFSRVSVSVRPCFLALFFCWYPLGITGKKKKIGMAAGADILFLEISLPNS